MAIETWRGVRTGVVIKFPRGADKDEKPISPEDPSATAEIRHPAACDDRGRQVERTGGHGAEAAVSPRPVADDHV